MSVRRLTKEQKAQVVQWLACFETPSEVVDRVKKEFGVEISRQGIEVYDPTKAAGKKLNEDLRSLFYAAREQFTSDMATVDVAHQGARLRMLSEMIRAAKKSKNYALAGQLLEQAAKERGGLYTNKRELKVDDKRKTLAELLGVSPEQLPDHESTVH